MRRSKLWKVSYIRHPSLSLSLLTFKWFNIFLTSYVYIDIYFEMYGTDTYCLWQTHTFFAKQTITGTDRLSDTDTHRLWQTHTVCDIHRLSVTDRDCMSQIQIVFVRHRLSVTYTDCQWHTQTVYSIGVLSAPEAQHFYHWHFEHN